MLSVTNTPAEGLVRKLYISELLDYEIYSRLADAEENAELKHLLKKLANTDKRHMHLWGKAASITEPYVASRFARLKISAYLIAERLLGAPFVLMILSKNEISALERYTNAIKGKRLNAEDSKRLSLIIKEERENQAEIQEKAVKYSSQLSNIKSIVLGLNDGLVEVLAAVAGIAAIASSSVIVALAGIIIGISGTLSMAGGVYLSAKSHGLLGEDEVDYDVKGNSTPFSEALYTGIYYFIGAFVSVLPFLLGLSGFEGIITSVILASLVLTTASVLIAVASGTSIRKRVFEMLAISLGAVAITVILGTIARLYFGIVI